MCIYREVIIFILNNTSFISALDKSNAFIQFGWLFLTLLYLILSKT